MELMPRMSSRRLPWIDTRDLADSGAEALAGKWMSRRRCHRSALPGFGAKKSQSRFVKSGLSSRQRWLTPFLASRNFGRRCANRDVCTVATFFPLAHFSQLLFERSGDIRKRSAIPAMIVADKKLASASPALLLIRSRTSAFRSTRTAFETRWSGSIPTSSSINHRALDVPSNLSLNETVLTGIRSWEPSKYRDQTVGPPSHRSTSELQIRTKIIALLTSVPKPDEARFSCLAISRGGYLQEVCFEESERGRSLLVHSCAASCSAKPSDTGGSEPRW